MELITSKSETCCFTGHRPNKLGGYREPNETSERVKGMLAAAVREQYAAGCRGFLTGMALGVDTWAGEIVLALSKELDGLRLIAAVPFIQQPLAWPEAGWGRWARLLKGCDEIVLVNENRIVTIAEIQARLRPLWGKKDQGVPEAAKLLNARNDWMVAHSRRVLAVWDGSSGGTGNCVAAAGRQGCQIVRLDPREGALVSVEERG